jgi:hypothetical protein
MTGSERDFRREIREAVRYERGLVVKALLVLIVVAVVVVLRVLYFTLRGETDEAENRYAVAGGHHVRGRAGTDDRGHGRGADRGQRYPGRQP